MKSEICGIELVVRMVGRNDVGDESSRSLTLPKAVDEQCVECGVCGVVLTQPLQETQDAEEPPFTASNKTVLTWNLYVKVWVLMMLVMVLRIRGSF
jgi:hypothetical protein